MMETWEYFTTTFVAKTEVAPVPVTDEIPAAGHPKFSVFAPTPPPSENNPASYPKYSVYSLIPQLNEFGARGWELVTLDPVQEGKNGDVRLCDASSAEWTYTYLAAFKRRTNID